MWSAISHADDFSGMSNITPEFLFTPCSHYEPRRLFQFKHSHNLPYLILSSPYYYIEADFKDAVLKYQQSLKELNKSHLIEIKNLKFQTHKPLLYQMIGYLLRMSKNNSESATA